MRKEVEENIRKDNEKKLNREAEKNAKKKQRQEAFKESQELKENIEKISERPQADFKKFQSFFDFLRQKKWLNIGEVGLFGSRVYKEIIKQSNSCETISDNPKTDFDFFCIPKDKESRGIFITCPDETAARINLETLLEEFNKQNPNLQISFLKEESGKKSVNHGKTIDSLNFKLVANFFEDKIEEGKTEKIVKEQVEFDLNFYTQQSILQNLQWQINLERVLLSQDMDGNFQLRINQSNCDSSQEEMTIKKFISSTHNQEQKVFLYEANPQAGGFLNRIINKKGVYKYLGEEELNLIKLKIVNEFSEKLLKELEEYEGLLKAPIEDHNEIARAKKIEFEKIIKEVKEDLILSQITKDRVTTSISKARIAEVSSNGKLLA